MSMRSVFVERNFTIGLGDDFWEASYEFVMDIGQEVVDVLGQFIAYDGDVVCVGDACFPHGESLL